MSDDGERIRDRRSIRGIISFGLRFKISNLKWRKHNDDAVVQQAAEQLIKHMEESNVRMQMGPPGGQHSTPGDGEQGPGGTPFSTRGQRRE